MSTRKNDFKYRNVAIILDIFVKSYKRFKHGIIAILSKEQTDSEQFILLKKQTFMKAE